MAEILVAIRLIKFYAWEKPRSEQVAKLRGAELKLLYKSLLIQLMTHTFSEGLSNLALFGSISCYILLDPSAVNGSIIFTGLTILALIR